ncbi:hypothetical protein [Nocardia flavorosea]|uniref:hypothetical protein n=1 Tax=Nocardia flavorosea TaxID=53429 RepID=UPI0007A496B4|nr:hypothetical protein [Nocardia flavorosea]
MNDNPADQRLAAEQRARAAIDSQLAAAGWSVQDKRELNLFAALGVVVREVVMARGHGRADYLLYVDKKAVGVIEAKPMGTPLSGVEWQSSKYAEGLPAEVRLRATTWPIRPSRSSRTIAPRTTAGDSPRSTTWTS